VLAVSELDDLIAPSVDDNNLIAAVPGEDEDLIVPSTRPDLT
jgi:hypothetical protein